MTTGRSSTYDIRFVCRLTPKTIVAMNFYSKRMRERVEVSEEMEGTYI